MKKIKRNTTSIPEAINMAYNYDMSHKGFAIDHKEKILYVMEVTDIAIRNGNEELLNKAIALADKYPTYSGAVLHVMFLR